MKKNMAVVRSGKHLDTVVEIVGEKEMPIERHGVSDALVLCRFNDGKLEFILKDDLTSIELDPIDWEQRRYEIAKDAMAVFISSPSYPRAVAEDAVEYAEALIEELKKDKQKPKNEAQD
ncbi:hypothetical protein [Porphyromonas gulae]|uniref:Uncharacterized protein n=1 Tax=Porphyromonas gulae TaxID=111105 RepID=A0A0A2FAK0_9PORP|nr:hypothetical protein [Porphyromonas gulae]KGN88013.1 hypothetical protein HR08_01100 [Porphyromonas gulae]